MAAAGPVLARPHRDNALIRRGVVALGVGLVASSAAAVWGVYSFLHQRVLAGTDHAARLAAVDVYVGVDNRYTLARAFGVLALVMAWVSVLAALALGRRRAIGSPAGATATSLHRQASLLVLALAAAHVAVPYTSVDPPYGGWATALVPFGQPISWGIHSATYESLGILALYLGVVTGPTFYLVRARRRAWSVLHRLAGLVYLLAVGHAFLLGTDFVVRGPARVVLIAAQIPVAVLLGRRVAVSGPGPAARLGGAAAALGATGLAVLSVLAATGAALSGMRL